MVEQNRHLHGRMVERDPNASHVNNSQRIEFARPALKRLINLLHVGIHSTQCF